MSELWIYFDESGDPSVEVTSGDSEYFHVGMLTVNHEIPRSIVEKGLDNLKKDPDIKDNLLDKNTLQRNYFHACEDSKNAHSHFCNQIKTIKPLTFDLGSFEKSTANSNDCFLSTRNEFHKRMIDWVVNKITGQPSTKIHLRIAEQLSSFHSGSIEDWKAEFLDTMVMIAARNPNIQMFFPEMDIEVVQGNHPGIQVVDFILWAALRSYGPNMPKKKCPWASRLSLQKESEIQEIEGSISGITLFINEPIQAYYDLSVPLDAMKKPDQIPNMNKVCNYFCHVERSIQMFIQDGIPQSISHITAEITSVHNTLLNKSLSFQDITTFCRLAFMMFDTAPLYDFKNTYEVQFVIDAKHVFGIIVEKSDIRWHEYCRQWRNARVHILEKKPEALGRGSALTKTHL